MWYSKVKNKVRCDPKIPRLYERRPHRNRFRSQTWNAASVRTEDASSAFCMCTDEGTVWTRAVLFTTEKIKNGIGAALSESSLFLNIKRINRGCSTMMHPTQLLVKSQDMLGWLHLLAGLGKLQYCVETEVHASLRLPAKHRETAESELMSICNQNRLKMSWIYKCYMHYRGS